MTTMWAGQPGERKGAGQVQGSQTLEVRVRCHRSHISPITSESSSAYFHIPSTFCLAYLLPLFVAFLPNSFAESWELPQASVKQGNTTMVIRPYHPNKIKRGQSFQNKLCNNNNKQ